MKTVYLHTDKKKKKRDKTLCDIRTFLTHFMTNILNVQYENKFLGVSELNYDIEIKVTQLMTTVDIPAETLQKPVRNSYRRLCQHLSKASSFIQSHDKHPRHSSIKLRY